MQISRAIIWLVIAAGFCLLGFAPKVFDQLAQILGVSYAPTLAFTVALAIVAVQLLLNDIELSRIRVRYSRLTQQMAVLRNDLDSLKIPSAETPPPPQPDITTE